MPVPLFFVCVFRKELEVNEEPAEDSRESRKMRRRKKKDTQDQSTMYGHMEHK